MYWECVMGADTAGVPALGMELMACKVSILWRCVPGNLCTGGDRGAMPRSAFDCEWTRYTLRVSADHLVLE